VTQLLRHGGEGSALGDLTGREQEILALIAEGRSNHAICERLFLSPKTVETHVGPIFAKAWSISLTVFLAVHLVGLGGWEPVGEGHRECVESGFPPDGPPGAAGPGGVQ
jgi:DNA-binding CsgD family transcriptional regulator